MFVCCIKLIAQETGECGTPMPENYRTYDEVLTTSSMSAEALALQNYCINLYFTIVRNDDGSEGFDPADIPAAVEYVNQYFSPHGITFYNVGYMFYDDTAWNNETGGSGPLSVPNVINVYFRKSITIGGLPVAGVGIGNSRCIIRATNLSNGNSIKSVFAHELGHNLNLLHTHQCYYKPYNSSCLEMINGSNCATAGDMICDTPADPYLCNEPTINISQFNPDRTNLMSYYGGRNNFTLQQGQRMRNAILADPDLQSRRSNQCAIIEGNTAVCYGTEYNYSVVAYGSPISYSWSVSPQLQIVGSNTGNSVVVRAVSTSYNGVATVSVAINGIVKTKYLRLGSPVLYSNHHVSGLNDWVSVSSGNRGMVAPSSPSITSYYWKIEQDTLSNPPSCPYVSSRLARFAYTNETEYRSNLPHVAVNWGDCTGVYLFSCYGENDCGRILIEQRHVEVGESLYNPCYKMAVQLIAAPNPIINNELRVFINRPEMSDPCDFIQDYSLYYGYRDLSEIKNGIKIYDYYGNLIKSQEFLDEEYVLKDLNLSPGNYIVNLKTKDNEFRQTVIIVE